MTTTSCCEIEPSVVVHGSPSESDHFLMAVLSGEQENLVPVRYVLNGVRLLQARADDFASHAATCHYWLCERHCGYTPTGPVRTGSLYTNLPRRLVRDSRRSRDWTACVDRATGCRGRTGLLPERRSPATRGACTRATMRGDKKADSHHAARGATCVVRLQPGSPQGSGSPGSRHRSSSRQWR